jgi:outer membrane protein assembly factor BamB
MFSGFTATVIAQQSTGNWPMFRYDSAHTGVTTSTGPTQPVKLWSLVEGYFDGNFIGSSASVVNGIVYVGSNYNQVEQQGGNIYALNADTGAKIWNYYTGPSVAYGGGYYHGVQASPAVANGVVYVGSVDGKMYALNASTGARTTK